MGFKIGKLPSALEKIALEYNKTNEEVGMDALMGYRFYTTEKKMRPTEAYCETLIHLHKQYRQEPQYMNGEDE